MELNPYFWNNLARLGGAYYRFGEMDKAIKAFQQLTELEPGNPVDTVTWGAPTSRWASMTRASPHSKSHYRSSRPAIPIQISAPEYFYLKKYPEALSMFEKAVELNPEDETTMGNLADGYRIGGKYGQGK